jgi:hypothetical protein
MAKGQHDTDLKIQRIAGRIEGQLETIAPALGFTALELITQVGYLLFLQIDQVSHLPSSQGGPTASSPVELPEVEVDERPSAEVSQRTSARAKRNKRKQEAINQKVSASWTPARRKAQSERMRKMMKARNVAKRKAARG